MGKALTSRGKARRKRSRWARPPEPPTYRSTVPLSIDGGHGVTYSVAIVEGSEMNGMHVDFNHDVQTCRVRATDNARELLGRFKHAADVIIDRATTIAAEQSRRDLAIQVENLGRLVDVGTATTSNVRHAFRNAGALSGDGIDDFEPTLERLREAHGQFYKLPADEQRAVLNGWSACDDRPTAAQVTEPHPDDEVRRVLSLDLREQDVSCGHEFITQVGSARTPVCVVVQEGTSKADTLHFLAEAVRLFRDAWSVLVDDVSLANHLRHVVVNRVRDGQPIENALEAARVENARCGTLPARVMFDGTTADEGVFKLLATSERSGVGTQIATEESVDRNGLPIRVGDTIVQSDGGVIATHGASGAGRVLAVAGSAVIYTLGRGKGYSTATAGDCYRVTSAHEKGGASQTPITPSLGSSRSGETRAATSAA